MRFSYWCLIGALGLGTLQGCVAPEVVGGASAAPKVPKQAPAGTSAKPGSGDVTTSTDRRSATTMVEDDAIESKAQKRVEERYKEDARVGVATFDGFVLITGSAPTEASKMDIERIVGSIPNVKGIANELVVSSTPINDTAASDRRLTANVKYRFAKSTAFKAENVTVVTESGVVYLMGLVTRAEADAASDIASTTAGVQKVVRVFEYMDHAQ
jgi:osmotically-inducible protein OsmY